MIGYLPSDAKSLPHRLLLMIVGISLLHYRQLYLFSSDILQKKIAAHLPSVEVSGDTINHR